MPARSKTNPRLEEAKLQAEIEKIKATTQHTLIKTAKLQDQIIVRDDVIEILNDALSILNTSLDTLQPRLSRLLDIPVDKQQLIQQAVDEMKREFIDALSKIKNG